jgi:hypothetical protein
MANANQQKFLVLYSIPASVMADWMKTDPETRKAAEQKMGGEWQTWTGAHGKMLTATEAAGKTKRVTGEGVADAKNDIMLYSIVEAESHEAAANAFKDHPHLQIPQAFIEVMAVRPMGPM